MIGSILEFVLFFLPSVIYVRRLRARGATAEQARAAVAWRAGPTASYILAIVVALVLVPPTYLALRAIPTGPLSGSSGLHVSYGRATTVGGYAGIVLLAVAEEILFRGFIAGALIRRYGFAIGNTIQAFVFLAPHALLLLVSTAFWPLLPLQLVAGWLEGALRENSGSIGPPSVAHAVANVLAPLLLTL